MTSRCKRCNKYFNFQNTKGNKLTDQKCPCGGDYELLSSAEVISVDPGVIEVPAGVHSEMVRGKLIVFPYKNKLKEFFLFNRKDQKYVAFKPPVLKKVNK